MKRKREMEKVCSIHNAFETQELPCLLKLRHLPKVKLVRELFQQRAPSRSNGALSNIKPVLDSPLAPMVRGKGSESYLHTPNDFSLDNFACRNSTNLNQRHRRLSRGWVPLPSLLSSQPRGTKYFRRADSWLRKIREVATDASN
jgi:hypothetical protein